MLVTRRFYFSSAHRYYLRDLTEEENFKIFGVYSKLHGHNYVLDVTVEGEIDPKTGMVINTKELDELISPIVELVDHKNLNEDVPYFKENLPTTENIAIFFWNKIEPILPKAVKLKKITLRESEDLWVEYEGEGDKVNFFRSYEFSSAHRLNSEKLTPEENVRIYGKCNNIHGHGHSYKLTVGLKNKLNPRGMVVDLEKLDDEVNHVTEKINFRWLDKEVEFFKGNPSTTENILSFLRNNLENSLSSLFYLRIEETRKNIFELKWRRK